MWDMWQFEEWICGTDSLELHRVPTFWRKMLCVDPDNVLSIGWSTAHWRLPRQLSLWITINSYFTVCCGLIELHYNSGQEYHITDLFFLFYWINIKQIKLSLLKKLFIPFMNCLMTQVKLWEVKLSETNGSKFFNFLTFFLFVTSLFIYFNVLDSNCVSTLFISFLNIIDSVMTVTRDFSIITRWSYCSSKLLSYQEHFYITSI